MKAAIKRMKTDFEAKNKNEATDVSCKIYLSHPADKILPYMNIVVTGKNIRIFMFKLDRRQMKSLAHNLLKAATSHK